MSECAVTGAVRRADGPAPCRRTCALQLLDVAAKDLREVRDQLKAWRVLWDGLFRRDERPVWLPHWRQRHRQPFQDGVSVAELLIAVRRKLVEREIAYRALWLRRAWPGGPGSAWRRPAARSPPPTRTGNRESRGSSGEPSRSRRSSPATLSTWRNCSRSCWPIRRGSPIRSRAAGAPRRSRPPTAMIPGTGSAGCPGSGARPPGRPRTTRRALFAALAVVAPEPVALVLEDWVIASLRRAIDNPLSELERPSDWIGHDPDSAPVEMGYHDF